MEMKCDICRGRKATQVVIMRWTDEETEEEFVDRKLVCEEEAKFVEMIMDADRVEKKLLEPVHL